MNARIIIAMIAMVSCCLCWADKPAKNGAKDAAKELRKEAKALQKEGWRVLDGEKGLELQLAESRECHLTPWTENELVDEKYCIEMAQETSASLDMALARAKANALAMIAGSLRSDITAIVSCTRASQQVGDEVTEVSLTEQNASMRVSEHLNFSFPVLTIYRQLPSGHYEVQVEMAFDKTLLAQ